MKTTPEKVLADVRNQIATLSQDQQGHVYGAASGFRSLINEHPHLILAIALIGAEMDCKIFGQERTVTE